MNICELLRCQCIKAPLNVCVHKCLDSKSFAQLVVNNVYWVSHCVPPHLKTVRLNREFAGRVNLPVLAFVSCEELLSNSVAPSISENLGLNHWLLIWGQFL